MKKVILLVAVFLSGLYAQGQALPSFQFGIKGGGNFSKLEAKTKFDSENIVGYFGGIWARIGGAGIHVQPELYYAEKNSNFIANDATATNNVKFTSIDLPVLVGLKFGAAGVGLRVNTGPVVSFIVDEQQSFAQIQTNIFNGNFKNQAYAWQFGLGFDVSRLNIDVRYEKGLTDIAKSGYPETKLNLFTVGLGIRVF